MLHRDKLLAILLLFFLFSCSKKKDNTEVYLMFSKNIIGGNTEYKRVYISVTDTLINWKKHKLIGTSESCSYSNFHMDSLLCFNNEKNKMVSAILENECKQDLSDGIKIFYGVKIKDKWCFFSGAYIVLPREYYQKDIHTPLSLEKLHEIAMKEVFSGYLKKKDKGFLGNIFGKPEYEINDDFFNEINLPRVPFDERKTNLNTYFSCRELDDKKEYEDCFFRHESLSVWNEDSTYVTKDTYLYSPEFPVAKKIRQLKKGDLLRVIERIDNSQWCYVRMWDGNPYMGFIEKKAISEMKKK